MSMHECTACLHCMINMWCSLLLKPGRLIVVVPYHKSGNRAHWLSLPVVWALSDRWSWQWLEKETKHLFLALAWAGPKHVFWFFYSILFYLGTAWTALKQFDVFCPLGGSAPWDPPNNLALRPTYLVTVEAWKVGNKSYMFCVVIISNFVLQWYWNGSWKHSRILQWLLETFR